MPISTSIRFAAIILICMLCIVLGVTSAAADKRVALVIGNGAYQNVAKLANPTNDAAAIAAMLKNANFDEVRIYHDLGIRELRRAIAEFAHVARDADMAAVYYSGHGIEIDGTNYLIPIDAVLAEDIDISYETFSLDNLVKVLEPARRLRLVMLDACRDNPFVRSMKRTVGTRAVGRGLAAVEPTSINTLIGYAAKAGSVALDGDGINSPYATAVINHLTTPGLDLRLAFGRVRDDVLKNTNNKQEPFIYGSLGGENVSIVDSPPTPVAVTPQRPTGATSMNPLFDLMIPSPLGEKSLGRDDAPVTIVEYSSLNCPHCASFYQKTFPEFKKRYIDTGKVRFIFREFPLDELGLIASMVPRCAEPDKYYLLIDDLFREQSKWVVAPTTSALASLLEIAKQAGFTEDSFNACLRDQRVQDGILSVRERALKLGVRAVPAFFINGNYKSGFMSIEELDTAVASIVALPPPK